MSDSKLALEFRMKYQREGKGEEAHSPPKGRMTVRNNEWTSGNWGEGWQPARVLVTPVRPRDRSPASLVDDTPGKGLCGRLEFILQGCL